MFSPQPIYRPHIPYLAPIQGGLSENSSISILGVANKDMTRFFVNLLCGDAETSDVALHFNPRFDGWDKVVFNSRSEGSWQSEDKVRSMPFAKGEKFELTILVKKEDYKIKVNGQEFHSFKHRIPVSRVRAMQISGDVSVETINVENPNKGYPGGPAGGAGGGYPAGPGGFQGETGGGPGGFFPGGPAGGGGGMFPGGTGAGGNQPGGMFPGGYPGGQAPGGYPGGQAPGGYPGGQAPGGYPGGQAPGGYPGGQAPGGYPGGQAPGGYPGGQAPGGYPGGQAPGGYPGGQAPGGYPGAPAPGGGYPGAPGGFPGFPGVSGGCYPGGIGPGGYPGEPAGGAWPGFPGAPGSGGLRSTPVSNPIPGGMYPNRTVTVQGVVKSHADKMSFDLMMSRNKNIAFHLNPRFKEGVVVRNTKMGGSWGREERELQRNLFEVGKPFKLTIRSDDRKFSVHVDGGHLCDYVHRVQPLGEIDLLNINGDVQISDVHF